MIDIIIPLGKGSVWNDNELRFCLRSIDKYLTGFKTVTIVGEIPPWAINVIHLAALDEPGYVNREQNILNKTMKFMEQACTTDQVLFMNDDHFLLKPFVAESFPLFWDMTMSEKLDSMKQLTPYKNTMRNTVEILSMDPKDGLNRKHFDVHCPIVYNRKDFMWLYRDAKFPRYGVGIKTVYANAMTQDPGTKCPDLKFHEPLMRSSILHALEDRSWFSIGNKCLFQGDMKKVLEELFPEKSQFEI